MDMPKRTVLKAITWQVTGLVSMLLLGYLVMGSVAVAGGFALASTAVGSLCYILHERLWARVRWGRT